MFGLSFGNMATKVRGFGKSDGPSGGKDEKGKAKADPEASLRYAWQPAPRRQVPKAEVRRLIHTMQHNMTERQSAP